MSFVRYEPLSLLDRFQQEINRRGSRDLLSSDSWGDDGSSIATSNWSPAVDIKEEDTRYVILADLPGIDPKDIEITMESGILIIKGERVEVKEENKDAYKRVERVQGTFYRRFSLPDSTDVDKIEAKGKDGVLAIVIPKQEKVQPRKITVKS